MPSPGQSGIAYPGIAFKDVPLQWEQMRNFAGGEDSYDDPIDLGPATSQRMINVVVRDLLKARTRYGADPLGGQGSASPAGANPPACQGLYYFSNSTTGALLLAALGSHLYTWNGAAWSAALPGWKMFNSANILEAAPGMGSMLLSDCVGNLQVWNGTTFTDCGSDAITSPPVGATILMWHAGRMFASGVPAYPDTIWCSNLLSYGATQWNTTTRSFRVSGGDEDPIMGMAHAFGYTAVILKENSIWFLYTDPASPPANGDWAANPQGQSISDGIGCVGRKAWCMVSNDVVFLAQDGVRSVQRMEAAVGQYQVSAPISRPIQFWIDQINWNYASTSTATKYLEFVLFAVPLGVAQTPNTVLAYNWRLGVWCGVWQGWTPVMFAQPRFNGFNTLCFCDSAGNINLWKDRDSLIVDSTYLDNGAAIPTTLWTRSFTFGDLESPKRGWSARLRFNSGDADVSVVAIGDDAELNSYQATLAPTGSLLGVGKLGSFLLASEEPVLVPLSLRGLPTCNELYLQISSLAGWWELRNLTVGARVMPLKVK